MTPDDLNYFKGNHINLTVDDKNLDLVSAKDIAKEKAMENNQWNGKR